MLEINTFIPYSKFLHAEYVIHYDVSMFVNKSQCTVGRWSCTDAKVFRVTYYIVCLCGIHVVL